MKVWILSKSEFTHSVFSTWRKIYADPLNAGKEMFEQFDTRFSLHKEDAIIAEYYPATGANLVLKDGRRCTWTIDMLEVV